MEYLEIVSPADSDHVIVRLSRDAGQGVDEKIAERLAVAQVFAGDEFTGLGSADESWQPGDRDAGKSVAFSSRSGFSANGRPAQLNGEWWLLRFTAEEVRASGEIRIERPTSPTDPAHGAPDA